MNLTNILAIVAAGVSIVASLFSMASFFNTRKQKTECVKIYNDFQKEVKIHKNAQLNSQDKISTGDVGVFNNNKEM